MASKVEHLAARKLVC